MKKGTIKRALSVLLCAVMVLSTMTVGLSFIAGAANGDWVPVDFDYEYGYADVSAASYVIVDGTHALDKSGTAVAAKDVSGGLDGAAVWTVKKENGSYQINNDGVSVKVDNDVNLTITAVSENTVYIQGKNDSYLAYNTANRTFSSSNQPHALQLYIAPASEYVYELDTDGVDAGKEYLIASYAGTNDRIMSYNGTAIKATAVTVTNNTITLDNGDSDWTISGTSNASIKYGTGKYLSSTVTNSITVTDKQGESSFAISEYNLTSGLYYIKSGDTFYRYSGSNDAFSTTTSTASYYKNYLRLFKLVSVPSTDYNLVTYAVDKNKTIETPKEWASLNDGCSVIDVIGTDTKNLEAVIRASESFKVYTSLHSDGSSPAELNTGSKHITFDFSGVDTAKAGTYTVPVYYKTKQIGTVSVELLNERPVASATLVDTSGTVYAGVNSDDSTGAFVQVVYDDGSSALKPLTVGMLTGTFNKNTAGTYTGLTAKYGGVTVADNFTLNVIKGIGGGTEYKKYTPKQSGTYLENGNYVIMTTAKGNDGINIVLTGKVFENKNDNGLEGSTEYTLNGDILNCDKSFAVTVTHVSNNQYTFKTSYGKYINITRSARAGASFSDNAVNLTVGVNNNYESNVVISKTVNQNTYYLNQFSGNKSSVFGAYTAGFNDNGSRMQLYKEQVKSTYSLSATSHTIYVGDEFSLNDAVLIYSTDSSGNKTEIPLDDSNVKVVWQNNLDKNNAGTYTAAISYNGVEIGTFTVNVLEEKEIVSTTLLNLEGTVYVDSEIGMATGAYIRVEYEDGSVALKPVTVSMLSGNYNLKEINSYEELSVYYHGTCICDKNFTLHVEDFEQYPEYPEEGSVRVGKTANAPDFANNGVAKVELSATGVPMAPGIDIVFVLDTSSSMNYLMGTYNGQNVYCESDGANSKWFDENGNQLSISTSQVENQKTRLTVLHDTFSEVLQQLSGDNINGFPRDIDVAICDFNGYTMIDPTNDGTLTGTMNSRVYGDNAVGDNSQVFTGTKDYTAGAFIPAKEAVKFDVNKIVAKSGTNYDRAMEEAYNLLSAKKAAWDPDEKRTQYVVFMSDGATWQYNYIAECDAGDWNTYLKGLESKPEDIVRSTSTHKYFYHGLGNKHWTAEAIKGDADKFYPIIDRNQSQGTADVTGDGKADAYMQNVPGLGAKLFSIGYCLTEDHGVYVDAMKYVLQNIAQEDGYFNANSQEQLDLAFDTILNDMTQAGTEAYFADTLGAAYDLQTDTTYTKNGKTYTLDTPPTIEVYSYDLYTRADCEAGLVSEEDIGTRIPGDEHKHHIETITFSRDKNGKLVAKSDQLQGLEGYKDNCIINDVMYGKWVVYNFSNETVNIKLQTTDYMLEPESFYWRIGIVEQTEYVLNYWVYLTGSMEGTRQAGTYATNESAVLHYQNYKGYESQKATVSPRLPWDSAQVSYEFYLVNEDGQPVNSKGEVVPFAERVLVGRQQSHEILLNNTESTSSTIEAQGEIPEGYALYSPEASYTISIDSGTTPSAAYIDDDQPISGHDTVTTYCYSNEGKYHKDGKVEIDKLDYTDTHVAFGVLLVPSIIPDAVVIDYGIPVNISVLENDICIEKGATINNISKTIPAKTELYTVAHDESLFKEKIDEIVFDNGVATLMGSKIRYTPTKAEMDAEDVLAYEVIIDGKYYYSTVTVYPAQNIYYEEDFFTFTPENAWTLDGKRTGEFQAEDRPGTFNFESIDFNNVYGYDGEYDGETLTHSLGTAYMTNVDAKTPKTGDNAPAATFYFRGTGFDLFSVTSAMTGYVRVQVYSSDGSKYKDYSVNNYYGYTFNVDENKFIPNKDATGGLYQIPIIRARDYEYDTYKVVCLPYYNAMFDINKVGNYDIYIDGVRIYDPAGPEPSNSIQKVYEQDTEAYIQYLELKRNIVTANDFYKLNPDSSPSAVSTISGFTSGAMFIDGIESLENGENYETVYEKYLHDGPNNELYLRKGQAVAFYFEIDDSYEAPKSIQLGMKVVAGNSSEGSVMVMNSAQNKPQVVKVAGSAARYYDITNAFTWNPDLLSTKTRTGFKTVEESGFGKAAASGDYSAYEWKFIEKANESGKWYIANENGKRIILTLTESAGVTAGLDTTGDYFEITAREGLFTFRDATRIDKDHSKGYYFDYNEVMTGSEFGSADFYIYKADYEEGAEPVYTRIMTPDELEDGAKYIIVYHGIKDKIVSCEYDSYESETYTYRTYYPVVVMNNSDNIVSLTNFKTAFGPVEAMAAKKKIPLTSMITGPVTCSFGFSALNDFVLNPDYEDAKELDTSDITVEWEDTDLEVGAQAKLYIRTGSDVVSVKVGDTELTEFTDNGDGTKTWKYTFTLTEDFDGSYDITVSDENGNIGKLEKDSEDEEYFTEISLVESEPEENPDEPSEEETGFWAWLKRLVRRIIDFFKSIVKWVKSL